MPEDSPTTPGFADRENNNDIIESRGITALMAKGMLSGALVIGMAGCAFTKDHTFIDNIKKYIHDASVSISEAIKGKEVKVVDEHLVLNETVGTTPFGRITIHLYSHKHSGGLPNEYFVELEIDQDMMQTRSDTKEIHVFAGEEPVDHAKRDEYRSQVTVATLRSPAFSEGNKWGFSSKWLGTARLFFEVQEEMHALFLITDAPVDLNTLPLSEKFKKDPELVKRGYFESAPLNFQTDIANVYGSLHADSTYSSGEYVIDLHPEKNRDAIGLRMSSGRFIENNRPKKMNIP